MSDVDLDELVRLYWLGHASGEYDNVIDRLLDGDAPALLALVDRVRRAEAHTVESRTVAVAGRIAELERELAEAFEAVRAREDRIVELASERDAMASEMRRLRATLTCELCGREGYARCPGHCDNDD